MSDILEQSDGLTLRIVHDDDCPSPLEHDNAGTMACWHPHYNLGHEQPKQTFSDWIESKIDEKVLHNREEKAFREREARIREAFDAAYISLPLYLYDHGGITMNTGGYSDPWDSGQVGIIYISNANAVKECGKKHLTPKVREHAIACMQAEVREYASYLEGDCWGYVIEDASGKHIDSCWGFIGRDYCEQEARSAFKHAVAAAKEAAANEEFRLSYADTSGGD